METRHHLCRHIHECLCHHGEGNAVLHHPRNPICDVPEKENQTAHHRFIRCCSHSALLHHQCASLRKSCVLGKQRQHTTQLLRHLHSFSFCCLWKSGAGHHYTGGLTHLPSALPVAQPMGIRQLRDKHQDSGLRLCAAAN